MNNIVYAVIAVGLGVAISFQPPINATMAREEYRVGSCVLLKQSYPGNVCTTQYRYDAAGWMTWTIAHR